MFALSILLLAVASRMLTLFCFDHQVHSSSAEKRRLLSKIRATGQVVATRSGRIQSKPCFASCLRLPILADYSSQLRLQESNSASERCYNSMQAQKMGEAIGFRIPLLGPLRHHLHLALSARGPFDDPAVLSFNSVQSASRGSHARPCRCSG